METHAKKKSPNIEKITIREEFNSYTTKSLDSKYRITIGNKLFKLFQKHMNIDAYKIFISKTGDILLRPTVSVPSSEAWVYRNSEVIKKIRKGLKESKAGKIERVKDIDSFLKDLWYIP